MTGIAVLAKAPVPGFAKTRLIPRLGAEGAAALQERLLDRALATARGAAIGPVTLWCAPDETHPAFAAARARHGVRLARQPEGDIGDRMGAAFAAAPGPLALIGTDCPVLAPADLLATRDALHAGADVVLSPAEDGGYGLIALARPQPALFEGIPWSTEGVMGATLAQAARAGLSVRCLPTIWDVDVPADLDRLAASGLIPLPLVGRG